MQNKWRISLLLVSILGLTACNSTEPKPSSTTLPLVAPANFAALAVDIEQRGFDCEFFSPYQGNLVFRSKYEGSGKGRDTLNTEAYSAYKAATDQIYGYSRYLSKLSQRLVSGKGTSGMLECYVANLAAWADADALVAPKEINDTGKAVRKWTLAELSSHYLRVSNTLKSKASAQDVYTIESWLGRLAVDVVKDYNKRPLKKVNNHDYWAGWSTMVTSVVLASPELWEWSVSVYERAMSQVDSDGFLPNEMRRASRAFEYHNFAMQPLAYMRAFMFANNQRVSGDLDDRFVALQANLLASIDSPDIFEEKTGVEQTAYEAAKFGRMIWIIAVPDNMLERSKVVDLVNSYDLSKQGNSRLGGKACDIFTGRCY